MTRSMIGVVAMLLGSLPTEAQVIHLLCDGSVKIPELDNNKPRRYEKDMKMIIDLNNRTVAFSDLTARITKIDADYAYLVDRDSTRGMWGHIDRVGGTARVWETADDLSTKRRIIGGEWNLTCRRERPLF
jgi:hypothetical protein